MTERTPPRPARDLGEAIDLAVASGPEREALVSGELRLSYGELAQRIEAVAARLDEAGVGPGERVAMVLPNVPEFVTSFFGIARVGAIAMPLHAQSTEGEIGRRLADAEVRVVLADPGREPALRGLRSPRGEAPVVLWSPGSEPVGRPPVRRPSSLAPDPDRPVLTQHSTGQSGAAKRVTRTHRQLLREAARVSARLGIGPSDRILGVAPLFHAYGFANALLCALTNAATLVLLDGGAGDLLPRDILRTLASERVTGFPGVPFLFDALVAARLRQPPDLGALRYCTSAGAPLSPATASAFAERFGVPVHQLYGTTETGVISVDRGEGVPRSVGFPIPGVSVSILDPEGRPVPDGQAGEVAVRSEASALGYDQGGGGDDSRFLEGAFLPGDLGRVDPDGRLFLTGRKRLFVNVGGNKVDPLEVEEVLRALDGVRDVAVVGVPDPIGGERVKAVVVASEGCDRARLLAHCRDRLAPYKIPSAFAFRTEIPRSPLGKVLRRVLTDEEGPS